MQKNRFQKRDKNKYRNDLRCIKLRYARLPIIERFVSEFRSLHGSSDARTGRKPVAHVR